MVAYMAASVNRRILLRVPPWEALGPTDLRLVCPLRYVRVRSTTPGRMLMAPGLDAEIGIDSPIERRIDSR